MKFGGKVLYLPAALPDAVRGGGWLGGWVAEGPGVTQPQAPGLALVGD